tara:strand:+ start:22 stop:366 length:345 start_codon:yes stop_codon:yes gene_type:complete
VKPNSSSIFSCLPANQKIRITKIPREPWQVNQYVKGYPKGLIPDEFISVAKKKMPIEKTNQIANVIKSKALVFSQCCCCFDIFFPPYRLKEITILIMKFIGTPKNATNFCIFII